MWEDLSTGLFTIKVRIIGLDGVVTVHVADLVGAASDSVTNRKNLTFYDAMKTANGVELGREAVVVVLCVELIAIFICVRLVLRGG